MPDVPTPIAPQTPAPPSVSQPPVAVQVIDRAGDIVGVVAITLLCHWGKLSGEIATIAIGALLGVQTGVRQIGAAKTTAGLGALGIVLAGALSLAGADRAHQAVDAAAMIGGR